MLETAVDMVTEHGLRVSLDHLRLDEVVEAAGVARTSAYRRWPYKDLFIADLLIELAQASRLGTAWGETDALIIDTLSAMIPRPAHIDPDQDRLDVLVEVLRASAHADVDAVHDSPDWRTHIALQATLIGLPEGELRNAVSANLRAAEQRFGAIRAEAFRRLAPYWGYAPVSFGATGRGPDALDGFAQLALALSSTMTGLIVRSASDPAILRERWQLAPFGTSRRADWSASALALVQVILSYLRPVPITDWGDRRLEAAIAELRSIRSENGSG